MSDGGPVHGSIPDIRTSGGTYFLGRYRIVDEIGIGGMASVHLARMDGPGGFQKWVAIKKIHPHLVEDESFVQMFLDEARVAARISHPNVATVFDLGKHEETYWIAMEYLHGEPLREVMRRTEELGTAMPPEIACRVIADAAEGLHAAHELLGKNGEKLGLVHRDVTPHNLFVTYDGVTKVVDFGIAKFSSRMSHTRAGTLKGKLAYMSPEQVHGEGIDRRTDIFALGVVLWELTTGQRLFRMESDLDTLAKVQECNVARPSTLIRGYPVDLEKIVMKALSKNRGERFRTAREFSRALQSLLMRRGLFIASDEVASYTQSIFTDRIQKREAHLRWAAEVTQTINVEQMLSKPKIGPEYTNSELQPAPSQAKVVPVRPAAGMPAASGPPSYPAPSVPTDLKATGPSLPTAPRPPSGAGMPPRPAPPVSSPVSSRAVAPPRPAAGMPAPTPPPITEEEPHPADGDGPTIQGLPPTDDSFTAERGPRLSEPPTLHEPQGALLESDAPTVMPGRRNGTPSIDAMPMIEPEPDPEFEDGDETIVANNRPDPHPLQAPPTFPRQSGRSVPPRPPPLGQTLGLAQQSPLAPPPPMYPPPPLLPNAHAQQHQQQQQQQHQQHHPHSHPQEMPYAETLGIGTSPLVQPLPEVHDPSRGMGAPLDFYPRMPAPTGHSNEFIARTQHPSYRMNPGMSRMGGAYDNRTMTAQRFKRRPPMWVVAALSCSIALLIAGLVIVIVSTTSTPGPAPAPARTVTAGTNGAGATATGPFTSARTAFNAALTPAPPTSANVAPPVVAAAVAPPPAVVETAASANAAPAPSPSPTTAAPTATATATQAAPRPQPPPAPAPQPVPTTVPKKTAPAALGALTVVCMPKCDQIIDNGTSLGPGHIFNRPVSAGRHLLVLSAPNGVKKNLQVEVAPEQTREVRIPMDK